MTKKDFTEDGGASQIMAGQQPKTEADAKELAAALEREENRREMEYLAYEAFQIDPERYMD